MSTLTRKHRLVVEVTFNQPITDLAATKVLTLALDKLDKDAHPIYATGKLYIDKLVVKSLRRLLRSKWSPTP